MIDENIRELNKKFKKIKNMGYVKTVKEGPTGVGATFEHLLEHNTESFEIPDYYGIEIKTKRSYSKAFITLFNAVPTGSHYHETKRLRDNYGYPSKKDKNLKCLYGDLFCNELTKIGLWYYFKLNIDEETNRLVLSIYNHRDELIDDTTYWDLDILKEKLERKLQVMALIKAWPNRINKEEYFKYYKMNIYILKDFESFIKALDNGYIKLSLKIDSYTDEKRYGNVSEHGLGFAISEDNLTEIFDIYR